MILFQMAKNGVEANLGLGYEALVVKWIHHWTLYVRVNEAEVRVSAGSTCRSGRNGRAENHIDRALCRAFLTTRNSDRIEERAQVQTKTRFETPRRVTEARPGPEHRVRSCRSKIGDPSRARVSAARIVINFNLM